MFASWAFTVQKPTREEALYVTTSCPLASLMPVEALSEPQELPWMGSLTLGLKESWRGSPVTAAPVESFTVIVTVDVLLPSAGMFRGTATTVTV